MVLFRGRGESGGVAKGVAMIPDLDIYRTANLLVKQHGRDAQIEAAMRADALLEAGDIEGCAVFKRVLKAVEELLSKERPPGASLQ